MSRKIISVIIATMLFLPPVSLAFGNSLLKVQTYYQNVPAPNFSGFRESGLVPSDTMVTVSIAIPLRNLELMDSLIQQISDPTSPMYRHFLTYDQIKNIFLPEDEFASVMSYIKSTNLKVVMNGSDSIIVVQGTAEQVKNFLGLEERLYTNGTARFYYGVGASKIPGVILYSSNATSLLLKPNILRIKNLNQGIINLGNVTFALSGYSMKLLRYAYNTTTLIQKGLDGRGFNVGILDFYGSPTVTQDLKQFDSIFGIQPPHSFKIVPIGAYDPNLGVETGWDGEIALDVESANAMAPGADITLYAANGALTLADAIAFIDSDKSNVTTVSQSFGIPENIFNQFDALTFYFNAYLADTYYKIGSLEGITFLASSGDAGGSGYSAGPEGNLIYPSSSPYVTSVGGTTTYISNGTSGYVIKQTAWSNLVYVPFFVNAGGGGGGVSVLEPKPWYQQKIQSPPTYPNGRLNPDIALQASVYPGSLIVIAGNVEITGGTSESSPLLAGLVAIWAQHVGSKLGLINPTLYAFGQDPVASKKAFTKVDFGYIVPWVAGQRYNLVTGWGAPNMGEIVSLALPTVSQLSITVLLRNSTLGRQSEYTSNQKIIILADVKNGNTPVTTGNFVANVETLAGYSQQIALSYDSTLGKWIGTYTVGNESGITFVNVEGTSGSLSGSGFAETFTGYFGTFVLPIATLPWSTLNRGILVIVNATDLFDRPAIIASPQFSLYSYNIIGNLYSLIANYPMVPVNGLYFNSITGKVPEGPATIVLGGGVFGYNPIMIGIDLQNTRIYPEVVAEPGVVAEGQSLFIAASPIAPLNIAFLPSFETGNPLYRDIATSSNVSASLVNAVGQTVATTHLISTSCKEAARICETNPIILNGYLTIPTGITPGLYTIMLHASFNSTTLGTTVYGSFFGQVYVTTSTLKSSLSVSPAVTFMGQNIQVRAKITYPNGTNVVNGLFNAFIYPRNLESVFTFVNHDYYAASSLITLSYDPKSGLWVGNVTLPSVYDLSSISPILSRTQQVSGPYDAFVTGLSFDGYALDVSSSMQKRFFIMPYLFISGKTLTSLEQTSGIAFSNDKITLSNGLLSNDLFLGTNTVQGGTVTIQSSTINGTLIVNNATLNLVGSTGGSIVAQNSKINLLNSMVESISLTGSTLSSKYSSFTSISPQPVSLTFVNPTQGANITGSVNVQVSLSGSSVTNATILLDGRKLASFTNPSSTLTTSLDTTSLPDGLHTLTVVAFQTDGVSSSASLTFYTSNQHVAAIKAQSSLQNQLSDANNKISSLQNQLNSKISSLQSQLNSTASQTNSLINRNTIIVGSLAAVSLILGVVALALAVTRRRAAEAKLA